MSERTGVLPATVEVELMAAFTLDGAGGNPAGVVVDARGLSGPQRQRIATAVGVSETAFVERAQDGAFAVEFFTPAAQVPDCGHATVGTFALLAQRGILRGTHAIKRTIVADRAISLEDGRVFMEQPPAAIEPFSRAAEIARALAIAPDAIAGEPVVADHGVRFVLVETTCDALAAAIPDQGAIEALTVAADAIGMYVYAQAHDGFDATIRMFAPRYGIPEESATGMAAGLLGSYLARASGRADFRFVQGARSPLNAPSELIVRVAPDGVLVGGVASHLRTLTIELAAG